MGTFTSGIGKNVNSDGSTAKDVIELFFVARICYVLILAYVTLTDIAAYPESVNVLSDITSDVRTPDKLIDGVNDTVDGRHMWLAPILPNIVRYQLFHLSLFDVCVCVQIKATGPHVVKTRQNKPP